MPAIKPSCIRDLKLRVNIADVVSRVVTLRGAGGSRLKGLCPFHQEKTPSFHVDTDKGFYKCFGCNKAGDIIEFVRESEQLNFSEAVETLGQRFNIEIEYEEGRGPNREERSLRAELFELHEIAAAYYHDCFRAESELGQFMRRYWMELRRFNLDVASEFKIGAAPVHSAAQNDGGAQGKARGESLAARLLGQRFSDEALRACGLFFVRDGAPISAATLRPRFRGRLMIPIRDHQGRIVAFTARQTELTPDDDPAREAKYVNSPETPIFTKGQLLFNLDRARSAASKGSPFVLVEGQLDAIRCWTVGLHTAVAPQGTAITDTQLQLLHRYQKQVECFFDSDTAGQKAALRLLPLGLRAGLELRFLQSADPRAKLDPDTLFLERGLPAYEELRDHALSAMSYACRALLPEPERASSEAKARAARELMEIIAATDSQILQSEFVSEAAKLLHIDAAAMQRDFQKARQNQRRGTASTAALEQRAAVADNIAVADINEGGAVSSGPPDEASAAARHATPSIKSSGAIPEEHLLLICLHFEPLGAPLARCLPHDWIDTRHPAGALLNRCLAEFEQDNWPGREQLDSLLETDAERALLASLLFEPPAFDEPHKIANEAMQLLRKRALEPRLQQIALDLARHGTESPAPPDPGALLQEQIELKRQLLRPLVLTTAV